MVSNLYSAKNFYVQQQKGKVASNMSEDKKLLKDSKGFYLNKSKSNGLNFKERVSVNDKVYARSGKDGVTKYNAELDRSKKTQALYESRKEHSNHAQMGDMARGSNGGVYKE